MIVQMLFELMMGLASVLVALIPTIDIDSNFFSSISSVSSFMSDVAYVVPMGTLTACLGVFFVLHNATLIIAIANWVIRKIPFIE